MTVAVLLGLVGAGLASYAATRTWAVELIPRPAPLPPTRTAATGGDLLPWLTALALVALAGAGAVLATRGVVRRIVGALLALIGLGIAAGAGYGLFGLTEAEVGPGWPLLCLVGGLLVTAGGAATAAGGHRWPAMGARYDRSTGAARRTAPARGADGRVGGGGTAAAWDALDRGEDPTVN
ncbi:Trp biosynthesis-associated membrane protein [Polymorphospora rubra]|uniref:Trp biosynthesis-associated membrane protein n=1 Tax=Polymorphospora rubra TaxID=338584 RepID=UPI001FE3C88C|nr:Trp biosynthesis-associated membrane protein [Polymorphospora rubra]